MKTRKNKKINKRKTKGGVIYSDPKKSCADIKKDWRTVWKTQRGYEKYNPYMFYPGKYNLIKSLPSQFDPVKNGRLVCREPSNKDCAVNKQDWELFWSKNPRYATYNPSTLYEGNDVIPPDMYGLTDENDKPKSCHTGAADEPRLTKTDLLRGIKPITLPMNELQSIKQ